MLVCASVCACADYKVLAYVCLYNPHTGSQLQQIDYLLNIGTSAWNPPVTMNNDWVISHIHAHTDWHFKCLARTHSQTYFTLLSYLPTALSSSCRSTVCPHRRAVGVAAMAAFSVGLAPPLAVEVIPKRSSVAYPAYSRVHLCVSI